MTAPPAADRRVPPYLGRILGSDGAPAGTCFQVTPGVLVTAWHVLLGIGTADIGDRVAVDPLAGGTGFEALVARIDPLRDLAVLTCEVRLAGTAGQLADADSVPLRARVAVTGHAVPDDPEHVYRFLVASGEWAGGTTRDDKVPLGRITASGVVPGMSGAPVVREDNGTVVGIVSGRYNSTDGWLAGTVWVARAEDLAALLGHLGKASRLGRVSRSPLIMGVAALVSAAVIAMGVYVLLPSQPAPLPPGERQFVTDMRDAFTFQSDVRDSGIASSGDQICGALKGGASVASEVPVVQDAWTNAAPGGAIHIIALAQQDICPAEGTRQTVTYVATGSHASVAYGPTGSDNQGTIPMSVTQPLGSPNYYAIDAQLQGSGTVRCQIKVDGVAIAAGSASGGYHSADCQIFRDKTNSWTSTSGG